MPTQQEVAEYYYYQQGVSFLVNGTFDNTKTTTPNSGVFLAVDNLNFSGFGTTTDIALYDNGDDSIEYGVNVDSGGNVDIIENGSVVATSVKTLSTGTNYDIVIQLQADKTAHYFLYNSTQAAWERIWVGSFVTSASLLYADDATTGATYTTAKERFGTGLTPETAAISVASPNVGALPDLPDGDVFIQFELTTLPSSGDILLHFRQQDTNHYWRFRIGAGGTFRIDEFDNGSATRITDVAGLVGGEVIRIVTRGNTITGYHDENEAGSYASANNYLRDVGFELNSLGTGGDISNLKVWKAYARQESGSDTVEDNFNNADNWTLQVAWSISGGLLTCTGTFGGTTKAIYDNLPVLGDYVRITFDVVRIDSGDISLRLDGAYLTTDISATGSYDTGWFVYTGGDIDFRSTTSGAGEFDGDIDNFVVQIAQFTPDTFGNELTQVVS